MPSIRDLFGVLGAAARGFSDDDGTSMAAAISYYAVFSLPPLLILVLMLASVVVDEQTVQEMITGEFTGMVGQDGAALVGTVIANAQRPGAGGPFAVLLGVGALLFGAAGAFSALQNVLNRAWEVAPDPASGGMRAFLVKRIVSFAMVGGIAVVLLLSLAVSVTLQALGTRLGGYLIAGVDTLFAETLNIVISLVIITSLFALMFRIVPDAVIGWRDVWTGAFATASLFVIGKFAIGVYLGQSNPGSPFGAAGSLAIVFVWIYYSAMIVIFGAELTQVWATRYGAGIEPGRGAVRVNEEYVADRRD